jgi:2,6-dihydroxypyridine 3-monooxygenase
MLTYEIPSPDLGAERSINWVWYRNLDEPDLDDVLTDPTGLQHDLSLAPGQVGPAHRDALLAAAADLPSPFTALVRATSEPFLQVVVDLEVPRMAHGRICLIGDAAFALRPHVAVGTAKAADDARALAGALAETADVPEALRIWEPERLTLARSAAARSREVGERAQFRGTFTPGDPEVAFGLRRPKDGSYPDLM